MRRIGILVAALALFSNCGRDAEPSKVVEADATDTGGTDTTGIGLTDATGDTDGDTGAETTGDTGTGGDDTGDTTDGGTGGQTGQTGGQTADGTATGAPEDPSGVYQGTHATTVTTNDTPEEFQGKIAVKVRDDGVFSGTGTGAGDTQAIELSVTGQVTGGAVTATVTWKWPPNEGQAPPPVVMDGEGTLNGETLTITFLGGNPAQKFQGTITMDKVPE